MPHPFIQKQPAAKPLLVDWQDCAWNSDIRFGLPLNGHYQRHRRSRNRIWLSRVCSSVAPDFRLTRRFGPARALSAHRSFVPRHWLPTTSGPRRPCRHLAPVLPARLSMQHLLHLMALPLRSFPPSRLQIRFLFQATDSTL